jgi:hypothetical protein
MQWPLTSQSHGSFSQREQLVFRYGSNSKSPKGPLFTGTAKGPWPLDEFSGNDFVQVRENAPALVLVGAFGFQVTSSRQCYKTEDESYYLKVTTLYPGRIRSHDPYVPKR